MSKSVPKSQYSINFDIGATNIRANLPLDGKNTKAIRVKTPSNQRSFVVIIKKIINKLSHNHAICKINIGIAGVISGYKVAKSSIIYLKNFDFKKIIPLNIELLVDNDARMFLRLAISTFKLNKAKRVLAFTIGTGIGRAYAENGQVQKIKLFEHAEKWEGNYQAWRFKNPKIVAEFLIKNLLPIIHKYQPQIIVFGGGVIKNKVGLVSALRTSLRALKVKSKLIFWTPK